MNRKSLLLSYRTLVVLLVAGLREATAECSVPMNGGLPVFEPLVLIPGDYPNGFTFKRPSNESALVFADGDNVRLVCTGPNNKFTFLVRSEQDITVTCDKNTFLYNNSPLDFSRFSCTFRSRITTRNVEDTLCNNDRNRIIEIGFQVTDNEFYTLVETCFDEMNLNSVWSKFNLVSAITYGEVGFSKRPSFLPGQYYRGLDPDQLYKKDTQRDTIKKIIGMTNANLYIPSKPKDSLLFLSRGHLTASADFVYTIQRYTTYYFINVAPQWYTFNDGTWSNLENAARYYASSREVDLMVFTGTHGVLTLPDHDGNQQQIYPDYDATSNTRRIAVPALFWKVLYNPANELGIAFVGVNNPHVSIDDVINDPKYQVCERKIEVGVLYWEICRRYQAQYKTQGYGYCCEVSEFRNFVTSLPAFNVVGVLE